jgi:hypothetical protein
MICSNCNNKEATRITSGYDKDENGNRVKWERCKMCGGSVSVPDVWWKKHKMPKNAGLISRHNAFVELEKRGQLNDGTKDKHIIEKSIKTFGKIGRAHV